MIEYLIKVSFMIGIAFTFYKAVLQQESFFAMNRFYLMACLVLAFALPFVSLPPLVSHQGYLSNILQNRGVTEATASLATALPGPSETAAGMETSEQLETQALSQHKQAEVGEKAEVREEQPVTGQSSWVFWLVMLYLFGVAVFSLSLLFQAGNILYKAITSTDKIQDGECVIVNTASIQAPCSFFRYIFIHPDDYDYETYEQIIAHEKIHVRQLHSLDLIIAEIAVILLWFNPFIWFFRKEVEKNNEYQTDATLLEEAQVNKRQYQLNLLQIAVPNKPLSITTNYNQSLLKQRILRMNARKSTAHAYWKYTFLAPLLFGALLLLNEPATSQNIRIPGIVPAPDFASAAPVTPVPGPGDPPSPAVPPSPAAPDVPMDVQTGKIGPTGQRDKIKPAKRKGMSINIQGADTDISQGFWYSHQNGGDYCIEFKGSRNTSTWNISRCFNKGLFQKKGNEVFVMTKETGTLQLNGALDAEVSQGKYTFTEDAGFRKYLADNNLTGSNKNFMFHLFLSDVDKKYVEFLRKQDNTLNGDRLLEFAIHGVSMQDYQKYVALFEKHSNKKPSMSEILEAKIHGIDEAYVQQIEAMGYKGLPLRKVMEAKIHGITAAYVEGLRKAGFDNLPLDKVIAAKIHGITPAAIKELQGLGFGNLSLDKMMEVKIHGVNAAYIQDLKSAGINNLTLDQIVEAKIHGLTAASIKEIRSLGFEDLSYRNMLSARIHGVNAAYVQDLKKAGFAKLTVEKTVEAKIHGINSDFIKQARDKGHNFKTIDKYIALKIHGMAIESLKD